MILSGVDKMTLCDNEEVSETDFDSAFFLPRDSVGKNRAEAAVVVSYFSFHLNARIKPDQWPIPGLPTNRSTILLVEIQ